MGRTTPTMRIAGLAACVLLAAPAAAQQRPRYDVTVTRTTYGIPHIRARDHGSLGYGAGYTAGEDNVCIIAEQLVTVRGERSAVFGAGPVAAGSDGTSNLESDLYYRVTGDRAAIRRAFDAQPADVRALITGFMAGYNRYLRDAAARLPVPCGGQPWVRPMDVEDTLLLMQGSLLAPVFLRQVAAAAPPGAPSAALHLVGLPIDEPATANGSNGWAFGADATANRRGLVVGNPHYPWNGPNRFRQMHLTIPGRLDVMGAGLVVTPLVGIGFNRDVAWTHTVTTARHQTIFELTLDPADPTAYMVDGRSEPMARQTITIPVKDGPAVTRTVYATRYGPVVAAPQQGLVWTRERAFAWRDANLHNLRGVEAWLGYAGARNVRELRDIAGRTLGIGFTNTIAADRHGDALYADVTPVPNVSAEKLDACKTALSAIAATQRIYLLDGARADCNWDVDPATAAPGLMPDRLLPTLYRRDWVQNSNDSYWLSNPAAPLPAASPLVGPVDARPSFRTQAGIRAIERALAAGRMTPQIARDTILANTSMAAERLIGDLVPICATDPALREPCEVLRAWDGKAELDSRGIVLFSFFLRQVAGNPAIFRVPFDPRNPVATPAGIAPAAADTVKRALAVAAQEMRTAGIPLDAPLSAVQSAPRAGGRIPIHGAGHAAGVLNMMQANLDGAHLDPVHGTSYIQVVGFTDRGVEADALLSYSQSTDPTSPHSSDQTRAFSAKRWHRLPFTDAEIRRETIGRPLRLRE